MNTVIRKIWLVLLIATALWAWHGGFGPTPMSRVSSAEAVVGRPATPISYAGVARRTTVRVATPGVGVNRGGPVNRVGRW